MLEYVPLQGRIERVFCRATSQNSYRYGSARPNAMLLRVTMLCSVCPSCHELTTSRRRCCSPINERNIVHLHDSIGSSRCGMVMSGVEKRCQNTREPRNTAGWESTFELANCVRQLGTNSGLLSELFVWPGENLEWGWLHVIRPGTFRARYIGFMNVVSSLCVGTLWHAESNNCDDVGDSAISSRVRTPSWGFYRIFCVKQVCIEIEAERAWMACSKSSCCFFTKQKQVHFLVDALVARLV